MLSVTQSFLETAKGKREHYLIPTTHDTVHSMSGNMRVLSTPLFDQSAFRVISMYSEVIMHGCGTQIEPGLVIWELIQVELIQTQTHPVIGYNCRWRTFPMSHWLWLLPPDTPHLHHTNHTTRQPINTLFSFSHFKCPEGRKVQIKPRNCDRYLQIRPYFTLGRIVMNNWMWLLFLLQ